jgi:hypothetical protein
MFFLKKSLNLDVTGKPLYTWDSRGQMVQNTYDELQRPVSVLLCTEHDPLSGTSCSLCLSGGKIIVEKPIYGTDATKNNIGQIVEQYDQSGKQQIKTYDFKGNPLQTTKKFAQEYENYFSWDDAAIQQFNHRTI